MEGTYTEAWTRGDHVRHPRFAGVALWFVGYKYHQECDLDDVWQDEEDRWMHGYKSWIDFETAVVRMVGDDRDHEVSSAELKALDEDEFCGGCGQVGCAHA